MSRKAFAAVCVKAEKPSSNKTQLKDAIKFVLTEYQDSLEAAIERRDDLLNDLKTCPLMIDCETLVEIVKEIDTRRDAILVLESHLGGLMKIKVDPKLMSDDGNDDSDDCDSDR